jgi:uncharacterized protein YbjT (DUF2867 family)
MASQPRVLLTGATGFVGRHIYPALVAAGFDVWCGTRDPERAKRADPSRHYCALDLADRPSVDAALRNVNRAVYLVHGMTQGISYPELEAAYATTFAEAAAEAGIERIVYLGGIPPRGRPSRHLASRLRTGEILRSGSVPVVELRATMIVGGASESFRVVRDLAARLPLMVLPRWLDSASEPVAIRDIGAAIAFALTMPLVKSVVLTAPGPERMSAREMILRTAAVMGHRPRVVGVPVVTPRLSSYWIRLVTRANPIVATELVEGLRSDIVSGGREIWDEMPPFARMSFDDAVRAALQEEAETLSARTRLLEGAIHQVARPTHGA